MKKAFKIIGLLIAIVLLILIAAPFVFKDDIKAMVKTFINENVNAKVEFNDVNLSFIKSFPKAYVSVNDLAITTFAPFENDTLVSAQSIAFNMSVRELFKAKNDSPIVINSIVLNKANVAIKTNAEGVSNYDIAKPSATVEDSTVDTTATTGFKFNINDYSINNSNFSYYDAKGQTAFALNDINHSGNAKITNTVSELDTKTTSNISISVGDTEYLKQHVISLDALIDLDLKNNIYTFKDNKALINQLPLAFQGYVQLLDKGQRIDLSFSNPGSDFKDFLAVVPKQYAKNLSDVSTTGNFKVNGSIKGLVSDVTIPKLDINIKADQASFKYPNLPKGVDDITINAAVKNTTGNVDDTYIAINTLNFKIDEDQFKSSGTLKNLTKNMRVNADVDGVLNLKKLTEAYPVKLDNNLQGTLAAKINTNFDMNAIETNAYERIKTIGDMHVSNFVYSSKDVVNPINISDATVDFDAKQVRLTNFKATTGTSDLQATGTIDNILGFLLSDSKLKGAFNVTANKFVVSDFMVEDQNTTTENKTTDDSVSLKIPDFLDAQIKANAKTVVYDNLNLKNVTGTLKIKDQKAQLSNMKSDVFNGSIAIDGTVSTQGKTPTFNLNLGIDKFDISESFKGLQLFQNLAPIAKALHGQLNTTLHVSGDLNESFSPNLNSLTGDAFAEILSSTISPNSEVLNQLNNQLQFIDFSKLDLKDLKTKLDFKDGKVSVKPFTIAYQDIGIEVSGTHSFTNLMDYKAVFNVPAKYLGSDVTKLLAQIDSDAAKTITIPVTANITGTQVNPKIKTDLSSAVTNLTNQLIEIKKQQLIKQGTDEIKDLIGGVLSGNNNEEPTDTTTTTSESDPVKDILGGILGGGNTSTESDSTENQPPKNNPIGNILGGLLGGKSKNKPKDSVN